MATLTRVAPPSMLYVLATSHGLHDLYTGVWVLVLTAQEAALNLTYTQVGLGQAAYTLASAVAQPVLGGYFDRTGKPYLALWSVALTTIMVSLAGLAPSYLLLIMAGIGAGLGSAAFHAAGLSNTKQLASGRGHGQATAIFLLGGNGGFAVGAYLGGVILDKYGAGWLTLPALVIVFLTPFLVRLLHPFLHGLENEPTRSTREVLLEGGRTVWLPIMAFVLVVGANQAFQGGITTYLPQFYKSEGETLEYAGQFTSLLLLFAAFGSFVGGSLADIFPRRVVAIGSMMAVAPLTYGVLHTQGLPLVILSIVLGLCTNMSLPILLLIGQEVLPGGKNAAGGYTFGLTFLTRALTTPVVGQAADTYGLLATLTFIGCIPLVLAVFMFLLPAQAQPKTLTAYNREPIKR